MLSAGDLASLGCPGANPQIEHADPDRITQGGLPFGSSFWDTLALHNPVPALPGFRVFFSPLKSVRREDSLYSPKVGAAAQDTLESLC